MEKLIRIFFIFLFISIISIGNAQSISYGGPIPFKPQSPLFGKDIVIHDSSTQNQRTLAVCSAFNGWLYAVYTYNKGIEPYISFIRSEDNGISWELIGDFANSSAHNITNKLDIIACGNSISTLKVFLASTVTDTSSFPAWGMEQVTRYQGDPFIGEQFILGDGGPLSVWDTEIAIAYDQNYPVNNSNPFSMAVAYSKPGDGNMDTLYFCSSSNGGMSFDNKRIVTLSNHHIEKVSLSFGRSLSKPEGRYFVAWDEKSTNNATMGHVYTAHTEPYFNSPFTKPVCLDSLDPAAINMGRNPSIACQLNNVNNDSINLTEVVLFDKFNSSTQRYDISGYYNLQATSHTNFKKLNISNSAHYNIQPSINFNHFDSTFMVTYYDSTTQKLIYLLNDFNLENPDNWQFISTGYNDSSHLAAPYPKVVLNQDQKKGANVWVSEGLIGNGVAMFDAPYSTYTGGTENIFSRKEGFSVYPNPCTSNIIVDFELQKASNVTIAIYNLVGQAAGMITNQDYSSGKHQVKCTINLSPGSYLCSYKTDDFSTTQKLMVIR